MSACDRIKRFRRTAVPWVAGTLAWSAVTAGSVAAPVDFQKSIQPLFAEHCLKCHGAEKEKGRLRLDRSDALKGGESGAAIVPGRPSESPLLNRITTNDADERMPPKGERLTPDEVLLVRRWIETEVFG